MIVYNNSRASWVRAVFEWLWTQVTVHVVTFTSTVLVSGFKHRIPFLTPPPRLSVPRHEALTHLTIVQQHTDHYRKSENRHLISLSSNLAHTVSLSCLQFSFLHSSSPFPPFFILILHPLFSRHKSQNSFGSVTSLPFPPLLWCCPDLVITMLCRPRDAQFTHRQPTVPHTTDILTDSQQRHRQLIDTDTGQTATSRCSCWRQYLLTKGSLHTASLLPFHLVSPIRTQFLHMWLASSPTFPYI